MAASLPDTPCHDQYHSVVPHRGSRLCTSLGSVTRPGECLAERRHRSGSTPHRYCVLLLETYTFFFLNYVFEEHKERYTRGYRGAFRTFEVRFRVCLKKRVARSDVYTAIEGGTRGVNTFMPASNTIYGQGGDAGHQLKPSKVKTFGASSARRTAARGPEIEEINNPVINLMHQRQKSQVRQLNVNTTTAGVAPFEATASDACLSPNVLLPTDTRKKIDWQGALSNPGDTERQRLRQTLEQAQAEVQLFDTYIKVGTGRHGACDRNDCHVCDPQPSF